MCVITVEISFRIGPVFLMELINFQGKLFFTAILPKIRSSENPTLPVQKAHAGNLNFKTGLRMYKGEKARMREGCHFFSTQSSIWDRNSEPSTSSGAVCRFESL